MSEQEQLLLIKAPKRKNRCHVCNHAQIDLIETMIYGGLTYDDILVELSARGIHNVTKQNLTAHLSMHIDKDQIDISKKTKLINTLADHRASILIQNGNTLTEQAASVMNRHFRESDQLNPENLAAAKAKMGTISQKIKKKARDLNLFEEMTYVMEINRERLDTARKQEQKAKTVLGITSKIADSHFKNAVKMHEITSGMDSLKDVRLAEMAMLFTSVMFRHEVTDITRFDMFRIFKSFEHVGLEAEQLTDNAKEAAQFEHTHSISEELQKLEYDKMLSARDQGSITDPSLDPKVKPKAKNYVITRKATLPVETEVEPPVESEGKPFSQPLPTKEPKSTPPKSKKIPFPGVTKPGGSLAKKSSKAKTKTKSPKPLGSAIAPFIKRKLTKSKKKK